VPAVWPIYLSEPITGLGRLGPAQSMLAGLDPTPPKKEKNKREWAESGL